MWQKLFDWMGDERPVTERVLMLLLAALAGCVLGMLVSPRRRIIIGSYNGNRNGDRRRRKSAKRS